MKFATADLFDYYADELQICEPIFFDFGGNNNFFGPIRTLKIFESFALTKSTLASDGEGHILVIDGGGSLRCAMLGDKLAQLAIDHGWSGVLINGCVRDSAAISALPIGVKALATNPTRPCMQGEGQLDVAVRFAGVTFHPGHFLYADADGVVLSQRNLLEKP
ncbi:MAG TPA: putative 4-hydroxy-4-methyl-2-oxoglutarate aldolase [Gammaproteobacteria bacterium]|nr:ribonuclease activity regulator protein RraA [Acidiferrobacteraceae bacterium]HCX88870.1 putative 4-hydroxy-4-methyl-2-oxoglutarate aldolase [Gammaproteobacteria bacterium]